MPAAQTGDDDQPLADALQLIEVVHDWPYDRAFAALVLFTKVMIETWANHPATSLADALRIEPGT